MSPSTSFSRSLALIALTVSRLANAQTTDIPSAVTINGVTASDDRRFFSASGTNESALLVENGADYSCTSCVFAKTGDFTNQNDNSFSDLNSAVSVQLGGKLTLYGGSVYTEGLGAHGFKMYEANSSAYIYDTVIAASDEFAHGVYIAGGYLYVEGATVSTNGEFSGAFSTDQGGGTMEIVNCNAMTLGNHSNLIYSTGNVTATNLKGQTLYGTAGTIDGNNYINIINPDFSVAPNFYGAFQIFNSFTAPTGTGVISVSGGSIAETRGEFGLLLASNSWAILYLKSVTLSLPSGNFINSAATEGWGTDGANGGNATVYCTDQTVTGSVTVDDISNVTLWLNSSSAYTGAINSAQAAGHVDLYLDQTSTWTVTGTSFVRILGNSKKNLSNIQSAGYTVYYTAAETPNNYLNNKAHALSGGGYLKPLHCLTKSTSNCDV